MAAEGAVALFDGPTQSSITAAKAHDDKVALFIDRRLCNISAMLQLPRTSPNQKGLTNTRAKFRPLSMSDILRNERRSAKAAYKGRDFLKAAKLNRALLAAHADELSGEERSAVNVDLGISLLRLGEIDEATAAFGEAVRLNPTSERAQALHDEWSGRVTELSESAPIGDVDPAFDFTPVASEAGPDQLIGLAGPKIMPALEPGGVIGVPHAEQRPPFAWGLLTPILCVVGVCLVIMILRSL